MNTYCFFKEKLSANDKRCYDALVQGLLSTQRSIDLGFVRGDIATIVQAVMSDNPMIFHAGDNITYSGLSGVQIRPKYTMSPEQKERANRAVLLNAQTIANRARKVGDEWQTVLNLHDQLASKVIYDLTEPNAHTAFSVLVHDRGVCDGISKAFKLCCDLLSVKCIFVNGKAKQTASSPFDAHAWNKVNVNGVWYNIDVTFDLACSQGGTVGHGYFLVSDGDIAPTHRADVATVACTSNGDYFGKTGYVYHSADGLTRYLVEKMDKLPFKLEIKFDPSVNMTGAPNEVIRAAQNALATLRRQGYISIRYAEEARAATLMVE